MASPVGLPELRRGAAAVDLSSWRKLFVGGSDARAWLNDLVTAEVADLEPGQARRSLLLTPTGRIRAEFTVTPWEDGFLLIQDSEQPDALQELLAPYVLSSDVRPEDRTAAHSLVAVPTEAAASPPGHPSWQPSAIGPGFDVLGDPGSPEALVPPGLELATLEALEAWRVERGRPRFAIDLLAESLPQEADWDEAIAYGKGCFLGQEAMAKVRNLGHPPYVVVAGTAQTEVGPGDALLSDGSEVGAVTSATRLPEGRMAVIARVRWSARSAPLTTASGARVTPGAPSRH